MQKSFLSINIPKLAVFTTEEGIEIIKNNLNNLKDWKSISELIPAKFKENKKLKKTGVAGIFDASLELAREGMINLMQSNIFIMET